MRTMHMTPNIKGMAMPKEKRLHVNLLKILYANGNDIIAHRNPHMMQIQASKKVKVKIVTPIGKDWYIFLTAVKFEMTEMQLKMRMTHIWMVL